MEFEWDVLEHEGVPLVYKRCALLNEICKSKRQAREAAAVDASIVNAIGGDFIVVLDLKGLRFRPCIYAFIKESVRLHAVLPRHTYLVNMPKWGLRVFRLARPLLSSADIASSSISLGPWVA